MPGKKPPMNEGIVNGKDNKIIIERMTAQTSRTKIFSIIFATLAALALNAVAAIPPAEKLLPEDTLILVSAPDFMVLREFYKTSPQTRLWSDPAMKPFVDKFISKLREELVQPLEHELGIHLDD